VKATAHPLAKGRIEYQTLSGGEVPAVAQAPGKQPVKTILEMVPPEAEEICVERE